MARNDEDYEVAHDGVILETEKAKQFKFAEGPAWIPRSQIRDETKNTVTIPLWLATEKGFT